MAGEALALGTPFDYPSDVAATASVWLPDGLKIGKEMRIAFYLAHFPKPGGTTTHVHGLSAALVRAGCDVEVWCQGVEDGRTVLDGVTIRTFERRSTNIPFSVPQRLISALRVDAPHLDLLILVGQFHRDLPVLARTALKSSVPYIVLSVGLYSPAMFRKHAIRKRVYWRLFERRILENAAGIQVAASIHESHLRALGILNRVITIPIGLQSSSEELSQLRRSSPVAGTPTLGYLGRLDLQTKGLDLLLDAIRRVRDTIPDLRVVLQGPDWGGEKVLRGLAERWGLNDVVRFRGPSYGESSELISRWDALALPSRHDGFGVVVLEAMAAARPVICSSEVGAAEHVTRSGGGIVVEPTVTSIASGIIQLFSVGADRVAMGRSGQSYLAAELNWDAVARRAVHAYAGVLAERRSVAPARWCENG